MNFLFGFENLYKLLRITVLLIYERNYAVMTRHNKVSGEIFILAIRGHEFNDVFGDV